MITLRKSWMLGAAALFCTVLWFALLAQRPLYDPDEGRYAEIPREMLSGGGWVIPHLNALVYLEKPPLQYWLTPAPFRGRLWGVHAGVRALLFTSASSLFVLLGHQLTLDMLLSFCLTACLSCFL